jgi:neutral ceramidase
MHVATFFLSSLLLTFAFPAHADFKAGFAETDITPAVGDPCKVRTVVLDDGRQRFALVGLDALVVPRHLVLAARQRIKEVCGIESVMVGASHSHSSGPIGMVQPGEFDHASDLVKDLAYQKSSCADANYLATVTNAIVDAVVAADASRIEATAGFGVGHEPTVAFNRRIRMKNGGAFSHPGKGNPENVAYAGPTDPQVGVIGVWNPDGELLGCIVNFACHATASGPWVSANWIHYLERIIQGYYGPKTKVVFLQGACGDVTQVDNLDTSANPDGDAWSQFVGGRIGAEAVKVLLGMSRTRTNDVPLASKAKTWNIPRRIPAPEHVAAALDLVRRNDTKNPDWVWAKETILLDALIAKEPRVEVEVQAFQIGPVVCISNPAEYFCRYGLDLKAESRFPITFPVELANGCVGYVPNEEAFDEKTGGGYETRLTSYSDLEITAGRQFRDAGLELARQLTPAKLPQPAPAPPFKAPWSYGKVPPQLK